MMSMMAPVSQCMDDAVLENLSKEHMMGTTIMAVRFDGGVVMGADSRTSTGTYIANRVSDKITPVAENIFCCRSGSAADTQAVSELVANIIQQHSVLTGGQTEVRVAANVFKEICYRNKNNLLAGIIVAGWDKRHGGSVFSVPLGGALVEQPFTIGGSGSTYIYGFCDSEYRENMTKEECVTFVTRALSLAMDRDGSSGGVARLCIVDKQGYERRLVSGKDLPFPRN
eukprot:c17937_g1_i1.p1 GENE.c17937_g1_i1~~c17937_g1_i1.p1  ORF type:complete len:246 (+),score=45.71 c17937_g1_i1:59-739(+)